MPLALRDVQQSLATGTTSVLLRHAAREAIVDPTKWREAALTSDGRAEARQLGRDLGALLQPGHRIVLRHSPVPRCHDTAAEILAGLLEWGHDVTSSVAHEHLGGPFVRDPAPVFEMAARMGDDFIRAWFDGHLAASLLDPLHVAARGQVAAALEASSDARLAVLVTHDWNVLTVREHFFGLRHETDGWAGFLDGVAVARVTGGGTVLRHGGRSVRVDGFD